MSEQQKREFKFACKEYLSTLGLMSLRPVGRKYGVDEPTKKAKLELVDAIVGILAGEIEPIEQSKRGAPVKNDNVPPQIFEEIAKLQWKYLNVISVEAIENNFIPTTTPSGEKLPTIQEEMQAFLAKGPNMLEFYSPEGEREARENAKREYVGQVENCKGTVCLMPLNGSLKEERIVVPVSLIHEYELREGDVVVCRAEKRAALKVATEILSLNGIKEKRNRRNRFEELDVCYPQKQIRFYDKEKAPSLLSKYVDWLFCVRHGQRGCLLAPPKAGKTTALYQMSKAAAALNPDLEVLVLLLEQPLEVVGKFKQSVQEGNFLYAGYEEDSVEKVFNAEFLLKRAKAFAECGKDVLLIVDSLNALARAYNDTEYSQGGRTLVGGMESKTLQYVKKYFGAGRCISKGGSLTILASLSFDTGNPVDDLLVSELLPLANLEMAFSDELARKKEFPAIDFKRSKILWADETEFEKAGLNLEQTLRGEYLPARGEDELRETLLKSESKGEFVGEVLKSIN